MTLVRDRFGCPIPREHALFAPWRIAWAHYDSWQCRQIEQEYIESIGPLTLAATKLAADLAVACAAVQNATNPTSPARDTGGIRNHNPHEEGLTLMVTETDTHVTDDAVDDAREAYEDARLHALADPTTADIGDAAELDDDDLDVVDRAHMLLADTTSAAIALNDTVREWTNAAFVDRIELLEFTVALSETADILTTVLRHVKAHANGLLADGEELRLPGGWSAKCGRPSTSWRWDAERLRGTVAAALRAHIAEYVRTARGAGLDDTAIAEGSADEAAEILFDILSSSPSAGWKTGGLKKLGISPDRFREKTDSSPARAVLTRPSFAEAFRQSVETDAGRRF